MYIFNTSGKPVFSEYLCIFCLRNYRIFTFVFLIILSFFQARIYSGQKNTAGNEQSDYYHYHTEKRSLTVGIVKDQMPFSSIDKNSEPIGHDIDIMKILAKRMNIDLNYKVSDSDKILYMLKEGEIDLALTIINNQKNRELCDFTIPVWFDSYTVFNNKNYKMNSISDLYDSKIGVLENDYAIEKFIIPMGLYDQIRTYESNHDMFLSLENNECDSILCPYNIGLYIVSSNSYKNIKCKKLVLFSFIYSFGLRKNNPDILGEFNYYLDEMKAEKLLYRINHQWGLENIKDKPYRKFFIALIIGAGIITALGMWVMTLRKNIKSQISELSYNEQRFRNIVKNFPDGILFLMSPNGIINYIDGQALALFGIDKGSISDKHIKEVFPADVYEKSRRHLDKAFNGDKSCCEVSWQEKFFEVTVVPLKDNMGNIDLIMGVVKDNTESQVFQNKLKMEQERLAITLGSIGDGVITTDTSGIILNMNQVAELITGINEKDAEGKHIKTVYRPFDEDRKSNVKSSIEIVLETGNPFKSVSPRILISPDNNARIITECGSPILDKEGKVIGAVLVFSDITENHAIMDIRQKADKLDSIGLLAGGIAHDFNNLLGGIYGYIDLALHTSKEPRIQKYLLSAMNTMDRATNLTQELLTFAKGGNPICKLLDISQFILDISNYVLSNKNISSSYDISPDLTFCYYDKNQIRQVLTNVLQNAIHAIKENGEIFISASNISFDINQHIYLPKGNYVKIIIADNGQGIPQSELSKVFDPFFSTKEMGMGLGLSICYSIIKKHGGFIDINSKEGEGTNVNIFLRAVECAPEKKEIPIIKVHKKTKKILLMDDEEYIRIISSTMIENMGHTCITARNGQEAIKEFFNASKENDPFDLVILDLTIPEGMGGKETMIEIRKLDGEIPVIVSSGYAGNEILADPVKYGFSDSICKPFRTSDLEEIILRNMMA